MWSSWKESEDDMVSYLIQILTTEVELESVVCLIPKPMSYPGTHQNVWHTVGA